MAAAGGTYGTFQRTPFYDALIEVLLYLNQRFKEAYGSWENDYQARLNDFARIVNQLGSGVHPARVSSRIPRQCFLWGSNRYRNVIDLALAQARENPAVVLAQVAAFKTYVSGQRVSAMVVGLQDLINPVPLQPAFYEVATAQSSTRSSHRTGHRVHPAPGPV